MRVLFMLQGVKRVSKSFCEMRLPGAFRKASVESLSSACGESHRVRSFFFDGRGRVWISMVQFMR